MSEDGTRVVTGGIDDIIREWNDVKGYAFGAHLPGCIAEELLAMSADCSQGVSGTCGNSVRVGIWATERRLGCR